MKITRKATTWFWVLLLCLPFLLYGVSVFRSGLIADRDAAQAVFAPGSFDPDAVDFVDVDSIDLESISTFHIVNAPEGMSFTWSGNKISYTFSNYRQRLMYSLYRFKVDSAGFYSLTLEMQGVDVPLSLSLWEGSYNYRVLSLADYSVFYLEAGEYDIVIYPVWSVGGALVPLTGSGSCTFVSLNRIESFAEYSTGLTSSPGSFQSFFLNNFDFPSFTSWMYKAPQYLFGSLSDGGLSLRESYNIYFVTSLICYLLVVTVVKFLVDILLLVPRIIAHYVNRLGGGDF